MVYLEITTEVENVGEITSDANVYLIIEDVEYPDFALWIGAWTIWDVVPMGWWRVPITVDNIDLLGAGNYKVKAQLWENASPGVKIGDLITDSTIVGGLYEDFVSMSNKLDDAESPFALTVSMEIKDHKSQVF